MHVALLSHEYPPFIYGGIGTFVQNLAQGLSKKGVKTTVVSGYPVPSKQFSRITLEEEKNAGVKVLRFPYLNIPPRHTFFQLFNLSKIRETIQSIDPDVVHGQGGSTFPALLALKSLAPIVTTFHSSPEVERITSAHSLGSGGSFGDFRTYVMGYPVMSFVFREELADSRMAVAVSKTLMSELLEEMGEVYQKKMSAIHNGVDIEGLSREYRSVEDNIEESDDTILFAGRLFWRKGALNLIMLAHLFRKAKLNFKIIVHGEGPLSGRMKREIKTLGLTNIELKGFTSRTHLMRSMKRCRFVVIPSFYEACPMILLESMCLGKIPIMFDLPYAREFTKNGQYGVLAKDAKDMVLKVTSILRHGDLEHVSKEIRNFSRKEYDINEIALKYYHLFGKL